MSYWMLRELADGGALCAVVPARDGTGDGLVVEWARLVRAQEVPLATHTEPCVRAYMAFCVCKEARWAAREMGVELVP